MDFKFKSQVMDAADMNRTMSRLALQIIERNGGTAHVLRLLRSAGFAPRVRFAAGLHRDRYFEAAPLSVAHAFTPIKPT